MNKSGSGINWFIFVIIAFSSCTKERLELSWTEMTIPTKEDLEEVIFINADTGYIGGGNLYENGLFLTTTDGGKSWTVDTLGIITLYDIEVIDENSIYAIGTNFYQTFNKGETWISRGLPDIGFYSNIDFYSPSQGVGAGGGSFRRGGLYIWEVNQEPRDTVQVDSLHEMNDAVMLDAQTIVAVGFGIVKRSTNGGLSFEIADIVGDNFMALDFPTSDIGYAVGTSGAVIKTIDGGESWQTIKSPNNFTQAKVKFKDVIFTDEDTGYLVGWNGTFWKTENGGESWIVSNNLPDVDFTSVFIIENRGYLTAKGGRCFQFIP